MGELETLLAYDQPSPKVEPDFSIVAQALVLLREPKVETNIEKEVKIAFEELKKGDAKEAKFDDIRPVVEQELDPSSYINNDYSIGIEYGGEKLQGHYETKEAIAEGNGASYTAEHKALEDAQAIADTARQSSETNHTFAERYIDEGIKAKITEQYIISFARWQTMYNGKIHFN